MSDATASRSPLPVVSDSATEVSFTVDTALYSREAILKTAHGFTGRCYVQLEAASDGRVLVRLRPQSPGIDMFGMQGEFLNALLDQTLRERIQEETAPVRNLILAHAFSQAAFLRPELETADPQADPEHLGTPDAFPRARG